MEEDNLKLPELEEINQEELKEIDNYLNSLPQRCDICYKEIQGQACQLDDLKACRACYERGLNA